MTHLLHDSRVVNRHIHRVSDWVVIHCSRLGCCLESRQLLVGSTHIIKLVLQLRLTHVRRGHGSPDCCFICSSRLSGQRVCVCLAHRIIVIFIGSLSLGREVDCSSTSTHCGGFLHHSHGPSLQRLGPYPNRVIDSCK